MNNTLVTFTGVDERTDMGRLIELQKKYPQAEFGFLMSRNRMGNDNRYPSMEFFGEIPHENCLNLALHLCGGLAGDTFMHGVDEAARLCFGSWGTFKRVQLNGLPEKIGDWKGDVFCGNREFIIQQDPNAELIIDKNIRNVYKGKISVLFDASGGRGVPCNFIPRSLGEDIRVGYAGGINPENVLKKWKDIKDGGVNTDFWIDMESGVRTDDWFDLDKVEDVLKQMFPLQ